MGAARIRVLPPSVVDRIAAGEVVARPASVVKELVENSLDAEAGRIEVHLEHGGCKAIRVADDGLGMAPDDLSLAFVSHATSKLSNPDDLLAIHSLGFRGEALASIGAVSHARIVSRQRGALAGAEVSVDGGRVEAVRACGGPEGTTVEVRNLFYNTPARLKFLRTPRTEYAHAGEAFTRLALPFPAVDFLLTHDGRTMLRLPGGVDLRERLRHLFSDDLARILAHAEAETPPLRVEVLVAPPTEHRANAQMIYAFLNGRYIRDRSIQRAIAEAFRGTLPGGRQPVAFLFLQMDPQRVDVNVHPTKVEVRFRDPGAVFALVRGTLMRALRPRGASAPPERPAVPEPRPDWGNPQERGRRLQRAISDFFTAQPAPQVDRLPPAAPLSSQQSAMPAGTGRFTQLHNAYIVEETADGLLIIDQHALHERILYEELSKRQGAAVASQRLLLPVTVELRPEALALAPEVAPTLAAIGFVVEEFGGNAVVIRAVPPPLDGDEARQALLDLLDDLVAGGRAARVEARERALKMMACKGAVKAGEALRPEEIHALLKRRDALGIPATCPHGRPTTWVITRAELERRFARR